MGIKNLYKFIEKYAPESIKMTEIKDYKNMNIGIDANLMIYKMIYAIRKNGYDIKNGDIKVTHIYSLILKIIKFRQYKINAIFVFDSKPDKIKHNELKKRDVAWKKMNNKYETSKTEEDKKKYFYCSKKITGQEIIECQKLIRILGFTVIIAPEEADSQLVQLYENKMIDKIISDDTDILLFGGPIIKNFSITKKNIQEIDLDKLKKILNFSQNELIKLGILLGSDYCDNSSISINKAYKIIKNMETGGEETLKKCKNAIEYFKNSKTDKIEKIEEIEIKIDEIYNYLRLFGYRDEYIEKIIKKLNYGDATLN